jgi:hypothetical protein
MIKKKKLLQSIFLYLSIFIIIFIINETFVLSLFASENDTSVVDLYGQLRVEGNKILNKNGEPIVLRGMSLFWSQWLGKYYNYDCVKWLRDDWKCTVVRAAMGIEEDGYLTNPESEMEKKSRKRGDWECWTPAGYVELQMLVSV